MMRHFSEAELELGDRPVLIVGRGPSYSKEKIFHAAMDDFFLCSINSAWTATDINFDLCVFIDWHASKFFRNCDLVDFFFTTTWALPVEGDYFLELKTLKNDKEKLFFFDTKKANCFPTREQITIKVSTSEAAIAILASLGAKTFHFTGVDGTFEHHKAFEKRHSTVLLENQFENFAKLEKKYGLCYVGLPTVYNIYKERVNNGYVI